MRVALLVLLLALPAAAADLDVAGDCYLDFFAQRQAGNAQYLVSDGTQWVDDAQAADPTASRKTFLSEFSLTFAGRATDVLTAYSEVSSTGGDAAADYAYLQAQLPADLTFTAGLTDIPFGNEYRSAGDGPLDDGVFYSDFSPRTNAVLIDATGIGATLAGNMAAGLLTWTAGVFNGAPPTVADSTGVTGWASPATADAKTVVGQVVVQPAAHCYLLAGYMAGDYRTAFGDMARATAASAGAGAVFFDCLNVNGEYGTTRHDRMTHDFGMGSMPPAGVREAVRVNECIVKATYTGASTWNAGVRYGLVDPKGPAAEAEAGFSREWQASAGARWRCAENVELYLEYSRLWIDLSYYDSYDAAQLGAGATSRRPRDPDDDILAAELWVGF